MVISSIKTNMQVYDNLAHYLFNQMVKAHDSENRFDIGHNFWLDNDHHCVGISDNVAHQSTLSDYDDGN